MTEVCELTCNFSPPFPSSSPLLPLHVEGSIQAMAPGRRKPARGEHRMDVAFDALLPMGFRKTAIRKKVLELLEVYGKPDGWIFIEEASYKLVIEALLGGEESEPGPPLLTQEVGNENNWLGDAGSSSAAGPSNANLICSPTVDAEKNGDSNQDSAITWTDDISFCKRENEYSSPPPPPPPESEFVPPPPPPPVEDMASEPPKAKRKPCYGWWGEETELVYLPLMPVRQHKPSQRTA